MNAAVTIDVDAVRHYHAIHGLGAPSGDDPILERGVRRFLELCDRLDVKSTIFAVGADIDDGYGALLRTAARAGHEIASHSFAHRYDMAALEATELDADLEAASAAIERAAGKRPRGFRAPGYNLSEALLDAVERAGFAYDSSVMPSPAYYLARAALIAGGRVSTSRLGRLREFMAPRAPYRPRRGACWARARSRVEGRELVEVPIGTMLGMPWLGTSLVVVPSTIAATMTALVAATSKSVVLELHAIDLCDAEDGFDPRLVAARADLSVPVRTKIARLEAVLRVLTQTADVVTVDEMARL